MVNYTIVILDGTLRDGIAKYSYETPTDCIVDRRNSYHDDNMVKNVRG